MFLQVNNIEKSYGKTQVLQGVSFGVEENKELAIVGASGSGKSTLLYILGALEKPDRGELLVEGRDISKLNDEKLAAFRNEYIGFIFQFHFLLPSMNCLSNMLLPARIGGKDLAAVKKRITKYAEILSVTHCLKKFPFEISGGEQQRINLIRAISLEPKLLLCDEPTGSLDSKNTEIVINLLRDVAKSINSTLIVVTHDEKVSQTFNHKITIEDGQIIS
ncbi:MAG: lipoprotein-releasing system ATP-binding protein LolD [Halobacteriovoraceae bacterium]|nr:lipoprotein-releasing system ATP-binding protein LolD [Halobacteriovoraceae bacterium]|tara:strand:+ start:2272 stop:2928 length:657 start_codon:yes stop_codon:yes gene_type:complete